jgi:hypothetical protein
METQNTNAAVDALLILAPPLRLVAWLESVFDAKRKRGEEVPEQFINWLQRWTNIRQGLPSEVDVLVQKEWEELRQLVLPGMPDVRKEYR